MNSRCAWRSKRIVWRVYGGTQPSSMALRQQLLALHARRPHHRLSTVDKLFWIGLLRFWSGWKQSPASGRISANECTIPCPKPASGLHRSCRGYFYYYALPGNTASLSLFRHRLLVLGWHTVRRRSQKHRISWTRMLALATRWLPKPQVLHPYPDARFPATHLR
jgi:hypothetical protein